jgi:hypothetical protein
VTTADPPCSRSYRVQTTPHLSDSSPSIRIDSQSAVRTPFETVTNDPHGRGRTTEALIPGSEYARA